MRQHNVKLDAEGYPVANQTVVSFYTTDGALVFFSSQCGKNIPNVVLEGIALQHNMSESLAKKVAEDYNLKFTSIFPVAR